MLVESLCRRVYKSSARQYCEYFRDPGDFHLCGYNGCNALYRFFLWHCEDYLGNHCVFFILLCHITCAINFILYLKWCEFVLFLYLLCKKWYIFLLRYMWRDIHSRHLAVSRKYTLCYFRLNEIFHTVQKRIKRYKTSYYICWEVVNDNIWKPKTKR